VLLERLGSGGMSEVFRAKAMGPEGFARTVAVKRVLSALAERKDFVRMFIDEAKISATLHHPNICQIHDFGRIGDSYFLAMEYVAGQSLRALQRRIRSRRRRVPLPLVLHLMNNLLDALDYAHGMTNERGEPLAIVHRDIKPSNVLVGYQGQVKLIDFGIAKAASRLSTTHGMGVKGTWCYMAPEQIRHGNLDNRTDIFAASLILHELLTGRRVYPKGSDPSIVELVRNADIKPPSQIRRSVTPQLDKIVMRGLAPDPAHRYATADAMRRSLVTIDISTGRRLSQQDVAALMRSLFSEELATEQERTQRFARIAAPDPTDETIEISEIDVLPEPESSDSPTPTDDSLAEVDSVETGSFSPLSVGVSGAGSPAKEPAELRSTTRWRKRRRLVPIVAIGVLVAAGVVVAVILLRGGDQEAATVRSHAPREPHEVRTGVQSRPLTDELTVRSVPPGARVQLLMKGREIKLARNRTPVAITGLVNGERYRVRLSHEGYIPVERDVVWGRNEPREMSFELNPLPGGATAAVEKTATRHTRVRTRSRPRRRRRRRPRRHVASRRPTPTPKPTPAQPKPPAPEPAPRPAAPPPKPAPASPPVTEKPSTGAKWGTLVIRSDIPGYVFVDGRNTGQLTPFRTRLPVGVHEVVIVLKGRDARVKHEVRIKPGKIKSLRLKGL
jgi:serine/threonine protein kinase